MSPKTKSGLGKPLTGRTSFLITFSTSSSAMLVGAVVGIDDDAESSAVVGIGGDAELSAVVGAGGGAETSFLPPMNTA